MPDAEYERRELRARVRARMADDGIPVGTDDPTLLALGSPLLPDADFERTPGECLTLGGHDGSPCSFCGRVARERPPAIPKAALERERAKHQHRSSHFRSAHIDGSGATDA